MSKYVLRPNINKPDDSDSKAFLAKLPYSSLVIGSKRFFEVLDLAISKTDNEEVAGFSINDSVINIFLLKKEANNEK